MSANGWILQSQISRLVFRIFYLYTSTLDPFYRNQAIRCDFRDSFTRIVATMSYKQTQIIKQSQDLSSFTKTIKALLSILAVGTFISSFRRRIASTKLGLMVPGYFLLSLALQRGHSDCFYSHSLILFSSNVWPQLATVSGQSMSSRLIGQMQQVIKSSRYLGVSLSYFYSIAVHYTILHAQDSQSYHISYNIDYSPNLTKQQHTHSPVNSDNITSLLVVPQVLDFIVVVVKQSAQIQLVVVLGLKLNCVALLRSFFAEHYFKVIWIVLDRHDIAHVVAEGIDCVVLT